MGPEGRTRPAFCTGGRTDVPGQAKRSLKKEGREGARQGAGLVRRTMEVDEEKVLCYLDKVLEDEDENVFECGDMDLESPLPPEDMLMTPVHRQFRVSLRLRPQWHPIPYIMHLF